MLCVVSNCQWFFKHILQLLCPDSVWGIEYGVPVLLGAHAVLPGCGLLPLSLSGKYKINQGKRLVLLWFITFCVTENEDENIEKMKSLLQLNV